MRVLFDTTFARRAPHSGTAVYIEQVTSALAGLEGVEIERVANARRRPPAGGGMGSVRNLLTDRWWSAVELPRRARRIGADLIHHPLPAHARWASLPQVITVHDLAFERLPDHFNPAFRRYAHITHRSAARAAAAVICDSETTAADARVRWGVKPEQLVVALLGPGQGIEPREHKPEHFLYVGDEEPRKNLNTLVSAYTSYRRRAEHPFELVLAGSASSQGQGVRVERSPTRERLAELYGAAVALIQPSLYEGFGLTALEAMHAGAPVIASDIAALREVCGGAAVFFDPRDAQRLAVAMAQVAEQPKLRADLTERGRRRAAQFSWEACARAHVRAYELALAAAPALHRG